MTDEERRDIVVRAAHEWVGTPFRKGYPRKQVSADCSSFILAVCNEAGLLKEIPTIDRHPRDFGAHGAPDHFLRDQFLRVLETSVADEVLVSEAEVSDLRRGDILVFSLYKTRNEHHLGIYVGDGKVAHCVNRIGVLVQNLEPMWAKRIVRVVRWELTR